MGPIHFTLLALAPIKLQSVVGFWLAECVNGLSSAIVLFVLLLEYQVGLNRPRNEGLPMEPKEPQKSTPKPP